MVKLEDIDILEVGLRDGLQNLSQIVPTTVKLSLLNGLVEAGCSRIQITSFVGDLKIKQFRDAEKLISLLPNIPEVDFSALVLNEKGVERALGSGLNRVEALRSVLDKRINLKLARQLDIPCPKQYELKGRQQVPEMIDTLGFPIVLKPPGNRYDPELPSFPFKVLYAHNVEQLHSYIDEYCQDHKFPIFQECAKGIIHNLCCFVTKGETIAIHEYHSQRRMRGVGVLRKVVENLQDTEIAAKKILRALKWDGVAHVAFFIDQNDKKLFYMETNGRLWASVEGSINAGWDFPYWIYRYFRFGEKPIPGPIDLGKQTCWHRGDLASLMIYICGGEVPSTGTQPSKIKAILQYLSGFKSGIHSEVFRWNDPVPEIIDHLNLGKQAIQTLSNLKIVGKANLYSSSTGS